MKLDTNIDGLDAIWKPYQILAINFLMKGGERNTREVWEYVNDKRIPISRASVINFLATLADEGLATFTEQSGKGGYHRIYTLVDLTMTAFNNSMIDKFLYKLWEIYPANNRIREALRV